MRVGSWCALLALAIQLTLTFGHVHAPGSGTSSASPWLVGLWVAQASGPEASARDAAAPAPGTPAAPANQTGSDYDYCAICWLSNLAGTAAPAVAPALPLPIAIGYARLEPTSEFAVTASAHRHFQARAPPFA